MVNRLNEGRSNKGIVAAVVAAFIVALSALVCGLVFGIRNRSRNAPAADSIARYLLVDAADGLNHTLSAMRLVTEPEPAAELSKTALVYAVRAETALECDHGNWADNRQKEAFLNDVATVLHFDDPLEAAKKSELLFKYSSMFFEHVKDGAEFEYNGELAGITDTDVGEADAPDAEVEAAAQLLRSVLSTDGEEYIGGYGHRLEFTLSRGGKSGYGVTEGTRIVEFSFEHSGGDGETDPDSAGKEAIRCAEACGFPGLTVFNTDIRNNYAVVSLCKMIDGALACDDCASVAVVDGEAVAFTAGHCDCEHKVPDVMVGEREARKAAPGSSAPGMLVTRTVNGRERVCYEYRYDLEDGVHFVFVCAESGKQMQVR